jgi:hypothetical protein
MKNSLLLLIVFFVASGPAFAGPLYGTVRIGQTQAAGVTISVTCPNSAPSRPVVTDAQGSFSLLVQGNGSCQMHVQRGPHIGRPFEVIVSNSALRFDFEINDAMDRVH